jgi:tripartite-type tricarboxylate transporter receptor subunit TctC
VKRRTFIAGLAAGAAALPAASLNAQAETYPSRPITLIVPFPAGGGTDIIARIMAERMRMSLGQSIIVENVTGANGTIGVGRAARATPDGYTIEMGQWSSHIIPGAIYALRYDTVRDFEPIAAIGIFPLVLYAQKSNASKRFEGIDNVAEIEPGQGISGNYDRWNACLWRVIPEGNRYALSICPLSRRGPGGPGFDGRSDRPDVEFIQQFGAGARWQNKGLHGHD